MFNEIRKNLTMTDNVLSILTIREKYNFCSIITYFNLVLNLCESKYIINIKSEICWYLLPNDSIFRCLVFGFPFHADELHTRSIERSWDAHLHRKRLISLYCNSVKQETSNYHFNLYKPNETEWYNKVQYSLENIIIFI